MHGQPPSSQQRPMVLVVDDEPEILVALQDLLEDRFEVRASTSPAEALDLLRSTPAISVIVSDQRMPEMPGNVFLARAREVSRAEAILLTGYADLAAIASAVNDGAISGYVHKPWEPEALLSMVTAAAERARLREALGFEQSVYAALVERSADAVSVLNHERQPVRVNPQKIAQQAEREERDAAHDAAADEAALAGGAYSDEEHRWTDAAGNPRWTRTRRIPFGDDPARRFLLKIESDETERRLAEQKLQQAEKLQALGTLAGGIAHDFNNLLAVVVGSIELAQRNRDDPEKLGRYLSRALEAANRGSATSRRLLSFSRQREAMVETFSPGAAIEEVHDLLQQAMSGRATVRLELAPDLWPVRADRDQFELALLNLCINARDAMPDGGEVLIRAGNAGDGSIPRALGKGEHVRIEVIDSGSGMTPDIKARVFDPFFTTKPHGVGTGLGLPIVLSMARAAGGDVTVESEPGVGTTFTMWLPRAEETPGAWEDAACAPRRGGRLRILLVEDDPALRATLEAQLSELGHTIEEAPDARAALDRLAGGGAFDLLITDYAMPRMTGAELVAKVQAQHPDLACMMVTAYADFDPPPDVLLLSKPFTTDQLAAAIAEAKG